MSMTASTDPRLGTGAVLAAIGLDPASEAVYRALLSDSCPDIARLAARLDLSQQEILASLRTLAKMSLVAPEAGEQSSPQPVRPQIGLAAVLLRQQEKLLGQQRVVSDGRAAVARFLAELPQAGRTGDGGRLEYLIGAAEVRERLTQLAAGVERQVCCLSARPRPDRPQWTDPVRLFEQPLAGGAVLRAVYPGSPDDDVVVCAARALVEVGAEVKVAPELAVRLTLLDHHTTVLPLDPFEGLESGVVVIRDRSVSHALAALFEQVWLQAPPLACGAGADEQGLTRRERALLRLLMTGMTDEAAGKRLGMSLRTVRRVMSDLMDRLDARSRFAAGARAQAYGWLSESD